MQFKQKTFTAGALYDKLAEDVKWLAIRTANPGVGGEALYAIKTLVDFSRGSLGCEAANGLAEVGARELHSVEGVREAMLSNLAREAVAGIVEALRPAGVQS